MRRVLWGRANSVNVMKVMWLLEELNLSYERIDWGGTFGGNDEPEYRAMNPIGKVPTLQEGEFSLWESNSILRYLCAAYAPDSSLWPQQIAERANIDRWLDAQQTLVTAPQTIIFWGLMRTEPEKRDYGAIQQAVIDTGRIWSMLDTELSERPYICGANLTLADFAWGAHVHRWFNLEINRPEPQPHLKAWYERLVERPAYRSTVGVAIT